MRQAVLILSLIFSSAASAGEMLSILLLPNSKKAVVAMTDGSAQAGFALCQLQGTQVEQCQWLTPRFPLKEMESIRARFEASLRRPERTPAQDGFELGILGGLGLTPGELALFYGLRSLNTPTVSDSVLTNYARLFNTDANSPLFVTYDPAVSPIKLIGALQFAAADAGR